MKGGKRSGTIIVERPRRYGGGIGVKLGKTKPAPRVVATWLGVRATWLGSISFWR